MKSPNFELTKKEIFDSPRLGDIVQMTDCEETFDIILTKLELPVLRFQGEDENGETYQVFYEPKSGKSWYLPDSMMIDMDVEDDEDEQWKEPNA